MNEEIVDQKSLEGNSPIEVSKSDLPLHCPMPGAALWNSHPRVFLPIEETGEAKCPYCGTEYKLVKT